MKSYDDSVEVKSELIAALYFRPSLSDFDHW